MPKQVDLNRSLLLLTKRNDAQKQKNTNEAEVKDRLGQVIRIKEEIEEQIIENQLQMEKKKENQEQKEGQDLKLEQQKRNIKQRREKYMEGKTYIMKQLNIQEMWLKQLSLI